MTQDTVVNLELEVEQKGNYILNRITFKSGKIAMEKTTDGKSRFTINHCCAYKVTNEGFPPKLDWIEFIRDCESDKFDIDSSYMRNCLIVMQNALTNAVNYHVNNHDAEREEPISEIDIMETANIFAKGVISGAQQLAKESLS